VVSFMYQPLYPGRKSLLYLLDMRLGGSQSWSRRSGEEINSHYCPCWESKQISKKSDLKEKPWRKAKCQTSQHESCEVPINCPSNSEHSIWQNTVRNRGTPENHPTAIVVMRIPKLIQVSTCMSPCSPTPQSYFNQTSIFQE
jgi:hypothetical protein